MQMPIVDTLELLRSDPTQFDLVITDMTMPHMTGEKLTAEILKIRPDIPIVLCTGYSEKIDEKKLDASSIRAYVMKPFVISEMANTIREVLDQAHNN